MSFISLVEGKQHVVSFALTQLESSKLIMCVEMYRTFQQGRGKNRLNAYYLLMRVCHSEMNLPGYLNLSENTEILSAKCS